MLEVEPMLGKCFATELPALVHVPIAAFEDPVWKLCAASFSTHLPPPSPIGCVFGCLGPWHRSCAGSKELELSPPTGVQG